MSKLIKMLALSLIAVMLLGLGIPALAEESNASSSEQPIEKQTKVQSPEEEQTDKIPQTPIEPVIENALTSDSAPTETPNSPQASQEVEASANASAEPAIEGAANESEGTVDIQQEEVSLIAASEATQMGTVSIKASTNSPAFGEQVRLTSTLSGFSDDVQPKYQWQINRNEGQGWKDIDGANQKNYKFTYSEESVNWRWRLVLSV